MHRRAFLALVVASPLARFFKPAADPFALVTADLPAPTVAVDKQLGIAVRFIQRYDVADRKPTRFDLYLPELARQYREGAMSEARGFDWYWPDPADVTFVAGDQWPEQLRAMRARAGDI